MFKKPLAHQSNATPIRSSARRQLVATIFEQYPSLHLKRDGERDEEDQVSEKELGRVFVPEGIRSGTFETSGKSEGVSGGGP